MWGCTEDAIKADSEAGNITIRNITNVWSEEDRAIDANTRFEEDRQNPDTGEDYTFKGDAHILIQNVSISAIDHDNNPDTDDALSADGILALTSDGYITIDGDADDTGTLTRGIKAKEIGILANSDGGDVLIEDFAYAWGGEDKGIQADSDGGMITIRNITTTASEGNWAIDADSRIVVEDDEGNTVEVTGGGYILIQDISVPDFDHDDKDTSPLVRSADGIRALSGHGSI